MSKWIFIFDTDQAQIYSSPICLGKNDPGLHMKGHWSCLLQACFLHLIYTNQAVSLIPSSAGLGQSGPFVSFSPPPPSRQNSTGDNSAKTRLHHLG
jgi:hypothetical protein